MAARNSVVIPNCDAYKDGNCTSYFGLNCPRGNEFCCCVCSEHFACFTSNIFGCVDADEAAKENVFADMIDSKWVNQSYETHCPMDGHL